MPLSSSVRAHLSRSALVCSLGYLLSGCSAVGEIVVVDHTPPNCILLEELSFLRVCDREGKVYPEDVKDCRKFAKRLGADTLECCRVDDEETIIIHHGVSESELPACIESRMRYARAYRCGATEK